MSKNFHFHRVIFRTSSKVNLFCSRTAVLSGLVCLFLLAGAGGASADITAKDKEQPRTPGSARPPVARAAQVTAVKGFPLEIRLRGLTASTRPLEFKLRTPPNHGRLEGVPVFVDKSTAVVKYIGDPGSKATVDSFSFAVKLENSGASNEADITILLEDPAPILEMPAGEDLGRVLGNDQIDHPLPILNKGNAPFNTTVTLPEGWTWVVPVGGKFDLAPGGRIDALVRIRIKDPGPIDQKISFRPGSEVRFSGRCLPPFLAYPELLRLQWQSGTQERSGSFKILNNRGAPITVQLSAPPEMSFPPSVTVPLAETVELKLSTTGALSSALTGRLRLEAPGWTQFINYEAPAAPALVTLTGATPEGVVDFGLLKVNDGKNPARSFTLRNVGGSGAVIHLDPLKLFALEGLGSESKLAPQSEIQFTIRPLTDKPGRLKERLDLNITGGDQSLQLMAEIDPEATRADLASGTLLKPAPPVTADGTPAPPPLTDAQERLLIHLRSGGLMEEIPKQDASLPTVDTVRMLAEEPDRLEFEWDAPGPGTWTSYRVLVFMLRVHGKDRVPLPEFDQMDNVTVTTTPTGGRAEVTKLRPGSRWACRIVAFRSDGVATPAGKQMNFFTPFEPDRRLTWRILGSFAIISLAFYIRQKWREDVKWKD